MCRNNKYDLYENYKKVGTITSFERIDFKIMEMRDSVRYELLPKGEVAIISLYSVRYKDEEDVLEERVEYPMKDTLDMLNACRVNEWDRFDGDDPDALDGTMFAIKARVNDNERIFGCGSNSFPQGYTEFVNALNSIIFKKRT